MTFLRSSILAIPLFFLAGITLPGAVPGRQKATPQQTHSVAVTFNYDFTKTPPCSAKATAKTCVKQFDVYDISGQRFKLFSIPAPAGATGVAKGITGQSPNRVFEPGTHIIAVTAENGNGTESEVTGAETTVVIP